MRLFSQKQCLTFLNAGSRCIACIIIYLSFLNCDWLLIRQVQWFYWIQVLLVPGEKFTVRMPMVRLELATPGLQTQCSSHWTIQLKSYCWEGVEFIQLVYCIIIYLSFLNCDWRLIREVQWYFHSICIYMVSQKIPYNLVNSKYIVVLLFSVVFAGVWQDV